MERRKVRFNKYIPIEFNRDPYGPEKGTGEWEKDYPNEGLFLAWGVNYEECNRNYGVGHFTIALIELEDGTVEEVKPSNLKFVK